MCPIQADEPGEVERRRNQRVVAHFSVSFREISEETAELLSEKMALADAWAASGSSPVPMSEAPPVEARTENLSLGGLSLTGDLELLADRKIEKGKKLLVEFQLPGERLPVTAVASVIWSIEGKGPKGKFTAGLMFTGIQASDLEKIQRFMDDSGRRGGG